MPEPSTDPDQIAPLEEVRLGSLFMILPILFRPLFRNDKCPKILNTLFNTFFFFFFLDYILLFMQLFLKVLSWMANIWGQHCLRMPFCLKFWCTKF